ncbi:hypothetical protein [Acinetobacter oleivorans]|nr:hypothetical protein [Acinetobacter oleivorans]
MVMNSAIKWNMDPEKAVDKYLNFTVKVLEECDINFKNFKYDALDITKKRLNGHNVDASRGEALDWYWDYIDERKAPMDFQDKEILKIRLGICLLIIDVNQFNDLNEHFSWFLKLMQNYGANENKLHSLANLFFNN